jgi:hypothetical protein
MEQANLYRMASLVSEEENPISWTLKPSSSSSHSASQKILQTTPKEKLIAFWRSVHEIEILRRHQVEHLSAVVVQQQQQSNSDHDKTTRISSSSPSLPVDAILHRVCDPVMRPYLSRQIRNIVEQFPQSAETIVQRHGLEPDEFNTLLHTMQVQPHFRQNIQKYMKQ